MNRTWSQQRIDQPWVHRAAVAVGIVALFGAVFGVLVQHEWVDGLVRLLLGVGLTWWGLVERPGRPQRGRIGREPGR